MSSSIKATQRCPRCGNENRADSFSCSFCGKRLRIEKIERINLFRRIEQEWTTPYPWYMKIYYLLVRPNLSFWDINHRRKDAPGYLIFLINSLLWGIMGLAFFSHYRIVSVNGEPINFFWLFSYGLSMFIAFLIFGLVFNFVFYIILIWLFTKGANYAVDFSEKLEARFGKEKKEKYSQAEMSPFSIYKGGVLLQKQQSYKYKMLMCAFAPFLLINVIKIIIILIAFPTVNVIIDSSEEFDSSIFNKMFKSPVWAVLDVIDALTIAIWVPILMAIGLRELSNSSTVRVLISSLIIGIIVAIFFYFLRPTLFG
ncbi:MAG: hypothetical protein ACFFAN_02075 [Promethearchaeota archaeon]